jgi:predicted dithiol-disulfide oxidoreductase (DUF899 family)
MSIAAGPQAAPFETRVEELTRLQTEFDSAQKKLLAAKRAQKPELVEDYELTGEGGKPVRLSEMFGDKSELTVIHNMGKRCVYCTLWADGFTGFVKHFEDRAGFVLTSPDDHETQSVFARERGWNFKMLSTKGSSFTIDMGYEPEPGSYWPGVSFFKREADGKIYRTAKDSFGPGDAYCSLWHLFDLLPLGLNDWEPKYHY